MEKSQKDVWDNIAPEWHEFRVKKNSSQGKHTIDFLKNKKGKIIDIGSGSGKNILRFSNDKDKKFYLVDFSEKMIELAQKEAEKQNVNAEFVVADMTDLPFRNNFFDYAVMESSLHSIPKQKHKKAVQELFRVLENKGQAEISVWNKNSKRFKNSLKEKYVAWRDKGKRQYYLFEPSEIYELFEESGFKIISKEQPRRMIVFIVEK